MDPNGLLFRPQQEEGLLCWSPTHRDAIMSPLALRACEDELDARCNTRCIGQIALARNATLTT